MSESRAEKSYEVVWLIRRLFRSMAQAADVYLEAIGISAADRAVMEFLYPDERLSVPEIAARYSASRQHVQVTANRLLDKGLIESTPNPKHKRSALLKLTEGGQAVFAGIRHNEADVLDHLFGDIEEEDLDATVATLRLLSVKLAQE